MTSARGTIPEGHPFGCPNPGRGNFKLCWAKETHSELPAKPVEAPI